MTPRQARIGVDVYTAAVIASVAVALAGLTWRLTGDPGIGPAASPVVASAGQPSDIRPLIAMAPFGSVSAVPAGSSDGAIKLKAIFMAIPIEASIVLIAGSDGKVASYGIGAAVGGGVIETILPEQVVLRTAQGLQTVGFNPNPAAMGSSATTTTATMTGPAPSVAPPVGANAVRALIPDSVQGRPAAPAPAPAAPQAAQGAGYPVGAAPAPELLAAGIRAGDIISRVNGSPVTAATDEREMMARAMAAGSAQVEVIRDGRRVSLTVAMH